MLSALHKCSTLSRVFFRKMIFTCSVLQNPSRCGWYSGDEASDWLWYWAWLCHAAHLSLVNTAVSLAEEGRLPKMSVQCMNKQLKCPTWDFLLLSPLRIQQPSIRTGSDQTDSLSKWNRFTFVTQRLMSLSYVTLFCNNTKSSWWKEFKEHQWMWFWNCFLRPTHLSLRLWTRYCALRWIFIMWVFDGDSVTFTEASTVATSLVLYRPPIRAWTAGFAFSSVHIQSFPFYYIRPSVDTLLLH